MVTSSNHQNEYELADLIDVEALQKLADSHFKSTGMPIGVISSTDDLVLVGAGWQDICLRFHRANPLTLKRCKESDRFISAHLNEGKLCEYKCLNGLWDIGMPIIVLGKHLATLFLGQFFYEGETPDRKFFVNQAEQLSFDKEAYLEALDNVPVFSREKVQTILDYNNALLDFITDLAEKALLQKQEREKRKKLEARLLQTQQLESIGQLAGGIAHDLNNLLSPILGYSELLLFDVNLDDIHKEKIKQIEKAGTGARDLIRQLLAFSRKQTLEVTSLNINDVILNYVDLLKRTIREDIEFKLSLSPEVKLILADCGQLEQVIMNLVVNAADSMPEGGTLIIETAAAILEEYHLVRKPGITPGEYVMMSCSDTGCGMNEETCKQIFEPFFSTKGELGTGLGLATVYGIIKQHNGNIWVYSEPDKGTTFKIYLPVAEKNIPGRPQKVMTGVDLKGNESLLLVEDNEQVMKITYDMLKYLGYDVLVAQNGKEAIALLSSQPNKTIKLLLTDVIMPDMNGRELFAKLTDIEPTLKVIYMSGYTDEIIGHHGILDEGVNFIQKPFSTEIIATKVREVLDQ